MTACDLGVLDIHLKATQPSYLSQHLGRAVHAWFFRAVGPEVAARIHPKQDEGTHREMPFTVSGLLRADSDAAVFGAVTAGDAARVRFTGLDADVVAALDQYQQQIAAALADGERVLADIDRLPWRVTGATWEDRTSYQTLIDAHRQAPPPPLPQRAADLNIVPELPASAKLTDAQIQQAAGVGKWLNDYIHWAGSAANETPLAFHLGAGLYLAAIAVGRRLYIHTPWRQQVFPNLYLMVVAVSTYYRKSAGLSLASEVARLAIPHMLMPQPGSPENFMSMLGGILPPNFADIPQLDRARLEKGNRYAAQRGLLRDELSGLFKSMERDYMAGLKELIMTLYDCPPYLDSNTNNKGLVVIRDTALSILGAAPPAELSSALSSSDWFNGNLARFGLLTPEPDYKERAAPKDSQTPTELANRLRRLHERLPEPPLPDALGEKKTSEAWSLSADIWTACHAYEQALRAMTAPGESLDDRLRAVYGRLHVQAIKVATLLAAMDWADEDGGLPHPKVAAAHWYRAQQIVEDWRASAHRLLGDLDENEKGRLGNCVLSLLKACGGSATVRDIYRALRSPCKAVLETLKAQEEDGRMIRIQNAHSGGVISWRSMNCWTRILPRLQHKSNFFILAFVTGVTKITRPVQSKLPEPCIT